MTDVLIDFAVAPKLTVDAEEVRRIVAEAQPPLLSPLEFTAYVDGFRMAQVYQRAADEVRRYGLTDLGTLHDQAAAVWLGVAMSGGQQVTTPN